MVNKASIPIAELSNKSIQMLSMRDSVLHDWMEEVQQSIKFAASIADPVLVNTVPVLYEQMCLMLTERFFLPDGIDATSLGTEHGNDRATRTDFDCESMLLEFQIFRRVLFDKIGLANIGIMPNERRALHLTVDSAVRSSMHAFNKAANTLRERQAATLAHDLRQPLANVSIAAELLAKPGIITTADRQLEFAQRIQRDVKRMFEMLNELLDTLAAQHTARMILTLASFDVAELVHSVIAGSPAYQKAKISIQTTSVVGCWNAASLERSLENLLNNAIRYGGDEKPIEVSVKQNNGRVILTVRNYGPSIPRDMLETIFTPYVRTDPNIGANAGGWGLGLHYVRTIAQGHGGTAVVFSDERSGTAFIIDIPLDATPFQTP